MFAFPLFLLADHISSGHDLVLAAAWVFTAAGLVLSYYATLEYVPVAREALHEGRAARRASTGAEVAAR
jgi:hypothetical protein